MEQRNELTPEYLYSLINGNAEKILSLERKAVKHDRQFRDIEEEYPLLPPEADDLAKAVQRKGVFCMGGKSQPAYRNTDLGKKIYRDIYTEIKRQYGLIDDMGRQKSYKKLKRKYLTGALTVVEMYELPIALQNEVETENELDE